VAVPRVVLAVGPDPDESNPFAPGAQRALGSLKQNICEPATPWAYRTVNNRVEWVGPRDDIRVDALLAGTVHHDVEARQDVESFLCRLLADGQYHESGTIEAAAAKQGITKDRLFRTRRKVCDSKRVGYGADGHWSWRIKPEFRAEPAIDGETLPALTSIPCTPTLPANNEGNGRLTTVESTTSSLLADGANNGGPANNDAADGWGEV
jgi:hypothetical protein